MQRSQNPEARSQNRNRYRYRNRSLPRHLVAALAFTPALLLSASLHAQVLTWNVETSRPAPADWPIFQGETITLEPRFLSYGAPLDLAGATATLYWSTNLTTHAWWSTPATITTGATPRVQATWHPGLDSGAPRYHYFIALEGGAPSPPHPAPSVSPRHAVVYRAHGTLTMRPSPGYSPAALPPPATVWVSPEALQATSNALATALQELDFTEHDPLALPALATHTNRTDNPHQLTAAQLGALTPAQLQATLTSYSATGTVLNAQIAYEALRATETYGLIPEGSADLQLKAEIAAATNEIITAYFTGTNLFVTISDGIFTAWQFNPTAATNEILWRSSENMGGGGDLDELWQAIYERATQMWVLDQLQYKASIAWGNHAPDGSANPEPNYMVWLNRPAVMYAAGYTWQTYGTLSALTSSGAVAHESGGTGSMRIGPANDPDSWFGFETGGSVVVGTLVNGFRVGASEVELDFAYSGGEFPKLFFTPSLTMLPGSELKTAVWQDNEDGTATAVVAKDSDSGFYWANTTVTIATKAVANMPLEVRGGIYGDTNALPVMYDSVITISAGGKTYKIPAELVP